MEKSSAAKIVSQTFQNPFNKDSFVYFIKSLLNHIDQAPFIYRGNFIPDAYKSYIKTLERIGKYQDKDDKKIDLLIVHLKKEKSLERARTMQRNFIAWYLNGSRGDILKDAALVAFVPPNSDDWRFSLVKMDYRLDTSEEKVKVKQELTPARRFSFLVGKTESSHTAQSCLVPILQDDDNDPTLKDLEDAFSIEKVTKEFFEKYRDLFLKVKETLEEVVKKDKKVGQDFKEKDIDTVNFAKKLLGQIVFLYFLQKKGWFGVERDEDWGTGPKNFLRLLFEKRIAKYDNLFNEILEPLFYEALAVERTDDFYSRFNCKIPFLNGGLFDPLNNYDWIHTDILLANELFSNSTKTKEGDVGTGILDIFDRYNFTVKEDEPLEKEVAIDPEMLGKVFENLLEIKDRKSKGTYYTPREIVHYMCQQSLINYLATELKDKIKKEDIETLIKYGETAVEHDSKVVEKGKETKTYSFKLPKSIRDNAELIDNKLESIRVCDPAVGSGAFPVGMMNEVVRTRNALTNHIKDKKERTIYDFKRHAIQNCLYGVDIDPGAVEIAKLRLWLSLVVDEENREKIQPLPNLDYKIMQGNSLLEEYQGIKLIDERFFKKQVSQDEIIKKIQERQNKLQKEYINLHSKKQLTAIKKTELEKKLFQINKEIQNYKAEPRNNYDPIGLFGISDKQKKAGQLLEMQNQFFGTTPKNEKDKLKEKIERLTWELIGTTLQEQGKENKLKEILQFQKTNIRPFFLWRLHFAEVFQEKNGFDVVIANPPYIDSETMTKNKDDFRDVYSKIYKSAKGNWDLFIIFIERGLNLLKEGAVITYIVPNKLLAARYSSELRSILLTKDIKELRDFSQVDVFKEVDVYPIIFIIQNSGDKNPVVMTKMKSETEVELSNKIPPDIFYKDLYWNKYFSPQNILKIILKISNFPSLRALCKKVSNAATVSEAYEFKKHITEYNPKLKVSYKKLINTGTIDQYVALWGRIKMRYIKDSYLKPIIFDKNLQSISLNRYKQACSAKIIIAGMSKGLECVYDQGEYLAGKSTNIILKDNLSKNINSKFLLSILNSKLISFWYKEFFGSLALAGGYLQINNREIEQIPIQKITISKQKPFIKIVDKILAITKSENYLQDEVKQKKVKEYEDQIDKMVYKLYGLTKEEIEIMEIYG